MDAEWVHSLECISPLVEHDLIPGMLSELPTYISISNGFTCDHDDVDKFTKSVLKWWQNHSAQVPTWATAARIVFSLTPNSAACERVFSLLKLMFGQQQLDALSDYLSAALMLRYNDRVVG